MELQNLQSIFNERIFHIPDYQRGYSWEKPQLNDLWRDIEILRENQYHYTGVLSVVSKANNVTSIVDGQQRITTLIILIQVICNCPQMKDTDWINGKKKAGYVEKYLYRQTGQQGEITEPVFGYEKDNPSHVYFKKTILGLEDSDSGVPARTFYTEKLSRAKKFFEDKIKDLSFSAIELILKKITEQFKLNFYVLEDELNEFVAFETMNNRGKPLSDLELLKNRLIYLSTLFRDHDDGERGELRKIINDAWKTVYEYLGKNPKKLLDDDAFLKDHWIMNFQYSREESKEYKKFLLNEHFTAENIITGKVMYGAVRDYALDVQRAVKSYYYLHNPHESEYSEDVKKWLLKLNRLGFGAFKPLIVSALANNVDDQRIVDILKFTERFVFVAFNCQFRRSNYRDTWIYGCVQTRHQQGNFDDVFNDLPTLEGNLSLDKFNENIQEYEKKFYEWKGIKYFLYEYELSIQESKNGDVKVVWEKVNSETIEHIFPQNPDSGWGHFVNQELLHDWGNLLLLSREINSKLKNSSFGKKKTEFKSNSYSAIEVAGYDDWTHESVEGRKKKMLEFLKKRWRLRDAE